MSRATQDAAGNGLEGEHVAGADKIGGGGRWVGEFLDGLCAVKRADAGGDAFAGIHGNGEGGAVAVLLLHRHHAAEAHSAQVGFFHGHANQATAVGGHEIDDFRGDFFARDDQVPFVFAVLVIHHQHHLAGAD